MRRSSCGLLVAASAVVACGGGYTTLDDEDISGGASAGRGNSAGSSTGGTGGRGEATGGRAGSGPGGAGRGGTTGGGAGTRQGGASGVGPAGAGGAAAGAGGERPTSCDDPLVTGDVSRFDAIDHLESYAVTGTTANELRASLNANRGGDYDALTTANINWTFRDCTNPTWSVTLDIVYDMPEWDPPTGADPALVASFATYIDALWCHEYGHGEIGVDCANTLYDALSDLPATGDCVALQSAAEAETLSVIDVCIATNEQYDAETNHGATMGAVFPP